HAGLGDRMDLVLVNRFGIVEQPADQGRFPIVHAAGRREAQQLFALLGFEEVLDVECRIPSRRHQKYPSRFLISMEPSWSWSITRLSRSDLRNPINSSMILGIVSASDRIAPVHGLHPSDRIRQRTILGFSPGSIGTNGCSSEINW